MRCEVWGVRREAWHAPFITNAVLAKPVFPRYCRYSFLGTCSDLNPECVLK